MRIVVHCIDHEAFGGKSVSELTEAKSSQLSLFHS